MEPLSIALGLAKFAPAVVRWIGGEKAGEAADKVVGIAEAVTGKKGNAALAAIEKDPNLAMQFQMAVLNRKSELDKAYLEAASEIISTETKSEHWLTANWRPIVMLDFALLITAHWLGFTPENLSEAQVLALLEIVKFGLGGYVVGRSVEKAVDKWKNG